MAETPTRNTNPGILDEAPPQPANLSTRKRTLVDMAKGGLGAEAATPQIQALEGIKQTQMGLQKLATLVPDIAPQIAQFLGQLEPLIAQFVAGGSPGPAGVSAAMGGAPMPPPPMAMGGGMMGAGAGAPPMMG